MDYSLYLHEFLILASAMFFALLSPGPDFAMILKQSVSYGKRASIFASIGIGCGISVHIVYSILGIGLIISKSIILFNIIKYLGAIYLIYLGYQSLKSKGIKFENSGEKENENISDLKSFSTGFLCNALNPKATLFFLSMFTVVISIDTPLYIQSLYGVFCILATMVWFVGVSFVLSHNKVRTFLNSFGKWFDRVVGTVLITLGIKVALSK
ncbi:LysE family translocator [Halarcobacter anaerophilus]|uniref:Lysine transporter LysE n=1 Tax=Halarcobacter anaerophilus TaxID=877500 RepID=A0A4Q0Y1R7_9BACT|nr:LysE family translocator [Halarcobacter anaerophilus]QDF30016.1 threonine/homoserine/homoserine lactone efflux protein, LysE family [Halarcobacter anaerophilus]RXJ63064.1 lysine transporter LysE [Halarcobacter anaerophilus]